MPYKQYSYTPLATNATYFASNVTGASWTLSTTSTTDDLAHLVTIKNDSATNHSGKTAVLTGTDADGKSITETLALPTGTATVTSTKYYKTLTSVVPSATISSDTMDIGLTAVSVSPVYPTNYMALGGVTSFAVTVTGTIDYTVQHTYDPVDSNSASAIYFSHASIAAQTTNKDGSYTVPIRGIRLLHNSLTATATTKFTVIEQGPY